MKNNLSPASWLRFSATPDKSQSTQEKTVKQVLSDLGSFARTHLMNTRFFKNVNFLKIVEHFLLIY